jgi:hypothetical protein
MGDTYVVLNNLFHMLARLEARTEVLFEKNSLTSEDCKLISDEYDIIVNTLNTVTDYMHRMQGTHPEMISTEEYQRNLGKLKFLANRVSQNIIQLMGISVSLDNGELK